MEERQHSYEEHVNYINYCLQAIIFFSVLCYASVAPFVCWFAWFMVLTAFIHISAAQKHM